MNKGTQVIYVPTHAEGNPAHPDAEPGFVTSATEEHAWVRYWVKPYHTQLRTVSNSEKTNRSDLVEQDTVPQARVDRLLMTLGYSDE